MGNAKIIVRRAPSVRHDAFASYKIMLDDQCVAKIKRGKQVEIETLPGTHRVEAMIDWASSPPCNLQIKDGETVYMTVAPAGNVFTSLFRPRQYITLTIDNED